VERSHCGCDSGGRGAGLWAILPLLVLLRRSAQPSSC
jgi:hypothetical protein